MNKAQCLTVIGLFVAVFFVNIGPAFAGQNQVSYYGKGIVDDSSQFAGEVLRTIINKDNAVVIHPGQHGIELVRMDIRTGDACIQTQSTLCYVGTVTETRNTDIHDVGDEVGITLDLENKKQVVTVISGAMQGATITVNLSKTMVKSDAPFVIELRREGGFAALPERTIVIDSSNNSITVSDTNLDSTMDLSQAEIEKISREIKKSNLFNIKQSEYPPHSNSADYFTYTMTLTQGTFQKTVTWTDASDKVPQRITSLNDAIIHASEAVELGELNSVIADIALDFVRTAPTFAYDGMEETLSVGDIMVLESFREQYQIEISFTSAHGGYGDRTDQMVTQVLTSHTMEILISEGNVISAVTDGEWDELNNQYLLKAP